MRGWAAHRHSPSPWMGQGCGSGTSRVPLSCPAEPSKPQVSQEPCQAHQGPPTVSRGLGARGIQTERGTSLRGPCSARRFCGNDSWPEPNAHHRTRGHGSCRVTGSPLAKGDTWWCDKHCVLFTPTQPVWELCHPSAPSSSSLGDSSLLRPRSRLAGTPELGRDTAPLVASGQGQPWRAPVSLGKSPALGGPRSPEGSSPQPAGLFQDGRRKWMVALFQVVACSAKVSPCPLPFPQGCADSSDRVTEPMRLENPSETIESNCSPAVPRPPQTHVPKCHMHTAVKSLQGCDSTPALGR